MVASQLKRPWDQHPKARIFEGATSKSGSAAVLMIPAAMRQISPVISDVADDARRIARPARPGRFVEPDQRDLPCPVLLEKIFRFASDPNHFYVPAIPPHTEGRFAIVTDVGCGMRWTRRVLLTRAPFPPSLKLRRTGTYPVEAFGVDASRTLNSCGPHTPTLVSSWRAQF